MQDNDFRHHVTHVVEQGYTILPLLLTSEECAEAVVQLDRLYALRDRGGLELIFNKARIFERLYQIAPFLRIVRHFLGDDALLSSMHGSVLGPGEGKGGLHADGSITGHNRARSMADDDGGERITSHVLALNTIWCISEFTDTNGATRLLPKSHLHTSLEMPKGGLERSVIARAPQGSVIVFNVNTWHGPSHNQTQAPRYAVLNPWRRHWTRCEYEMAEVVDPQVLERAGEERRIFGIDAEAPYVERWQWDRDKGGPTADHAHLARGKN
ncbi:MAG: phytanoyl-CoA dioxygenase family protein [Candidatus Latescibacteria bacterium]|nr:phytanoyl-CoA dioxygenase family protein [Candidatus Latescibacterota bacterium]